MPRRKSRSSYRQAPPSPAKSLVSPQVVFYRPDVEGDVLGDKLVVKTVPAGKIRQAIERGQGRVALAVVSDIGCLPMLVAETLFLVGTVPDGVDVVVALTETGSWDLSVRELVEDPDVPIAYSDVDGLAERAYASAPFVNDLQANTGLIYTGPVDPDVSDYTAMLSLASSVVSCCFAGRGAKAGVDWKSCVLAIADQPERLSDMVGYASLGMVSVKPSLLKPCPLPEWRKGALADLVLHSQFKYSKTWDEKHFRDVFSCSLLDGGDEELLRTARRMEKVAYIWKQVPLTFDEEHPPVPIDDVNPDSESVKERIEAINEVLGVKSFIEAYLAGVPLDDLFL